MGRILGLDYGDRRIGLALSDPSKMIASPFKFIINTGDDEVLDSLKILIAEEDIEAIVVGLPIGMKGQETKQTTKVREFSELLSSLTIPISFEDERLSSVSAEKSMIQQKIKTGHHKGMIDQRAAAILLQQYLDRYSK
mgnify:FL=1